MEKTLKRYDSNQHKTLIKNLLSLKQAVQKKVDFLNEYSELYKINKRTVTKNMKVYKDLLNAIETIESTSFSKNQFTKLD